MTQHISLEKLIDHFNQIHGPAEQEKIDAHLGICPACRATANSVVNEHRLIRQSLLNNLGQMSPSPEANFAAISPRLSGPGQTITFPFPSFRQSLASGVLLAILAIGVFILINSLRSPDLFSDRLIEKRIVPITNGDFEAESSGTPTGWHLSSQQWQEYLAQRDDTVYFDGQASALLTGTTSEAQAFGLLQQSLTSIESLRGQRIRLSAYIKTEEVDFAGLWLRVGGGSNQNLEFDNMQNRPIEGTNDWLLYEAVLDVPPKGESIDFGVLLGGNGRVWVDDVTLEVVGKQVPVTNTLPDLSQLDIEVEQSVSSDWFLAGTRPQDYTVSQDTTTFASGSASALLASKVEEAPEFGTLMQTFEPGNYLGHRVRLSALIKTEDVSGWAGLWLRVDGAGIQTLQFDNMQNRAIMGTTDWARYEVVLDVPPESKSINLGLILAGTGRVWIDEVSLEVVGQDVPSTNTVAFHPQPLNFDFEDSDSTGLPEGWILSETYWQDYTVSQDTTTFASGRASALLASTVGEAPEFGTLMQTFEPGNYLGQRVRLSALIKTEDVSGWAGLWLRVDDADHQILQFDNMQNRAIEGTTDWARYEVVLDVPLESMSINLGLILAGNGRVWIDNVTLEIVDDNVPSTHCPICLEEDGR